MCIRMVSGGDESPPGRGDRPNSIFMRYLTAKFGFRSNNVFLDTYS